MKKARYTGYSCVFSCPRSHFLPQKDEAKRERDKKSLRQAESRLNIAKCVSLTRLFYPTLLGTT